MHPITGFTTSSDRLLDDDSYTYDVSFSTDNNVIGNYIKFNGGFYQGFYKSFGYDYQTLPERFNLGWTSEFMLRYRWTGDTDTGLNARYPNNKGTFFYYGARAENKFYHYADGSPLSDSGYTRVTQGLNCLETCGCSSSANTASTCNYVYQQSGVTSQNCSCGQCPCNCSTYASIPEKDPKWDEVSNAMSLRLSGDTGSPRLCVKTYRITGDCETTGTCTTGLTYTTGTSVTEWCSTRGIFDDCSGSTYSETERWVQIDAVFQRNTYLDDCDLLYKGGLGEIVKTVYTASSANNSVSLIQPPITQELDYDPATVEVVEMNERWLEEKNYRLGTLKFYVNGKLFLVVNGFEEIIPRPLNTLRETQIGVAYNISLGGGTQGLHDNLTVTDCATTLTGMTYQQDPECLPTEVLDETSYSGLTTNIKLEEYFGGSFYGDISAFRMYTEPLNGAQIRHNFKLLKDKYALLDPFCLKCENSFIPVPVTPTPTVTPTLTPTPTVTATPTLTPTDIVESCSLIIFNWEGPEPPLFEFIDCSGNTIQMNGVESWSAEYCGNYDSALVLSGDGSISYIETCTDPSLYNPTTIPLGYSFTDPNESCINPTSNYYQSPGESLIVGDHIYTDYSLDPYFYVTDGYYSDGTNVYCVTGGTGYITSIIPCSVTPTPTPTPTLTSTPTLTQTVTETPTNTPTETPTNTPTPSSIYYYYFLLDCDLSNNKIGRSSFPGLTGIYLVDTSICYTIVGSDLGPSFDYDLDLSTNVSDCSDLICIPTPTPTPTLTSTPTLTPTETPTPTPTSTPTNTPTNTETPTPTITPTNTPTPSNTPEPVTGYSFNLIELPYNFPTSGNTILNNTGGIQSGSTEPNVLATGGRGLYWNVIDSNGIDRTNYFSQFTGQTVTITMSQTGSTAIYSGDTDSLKFWSGDTGSPPYVAGAGFVFGAGIGVPPIGTPSGTAVLIQSAPTEWTFGVPVYISAVIN
jgi:hypothetical protein